MATSNGDDVVRSTVPPLDHHASANRWRHQESREYREYNQPKARPAGDRGDRVSDLADFLHSTRIEPQKAVGKPVDSKFKPIVVGDDVMQSSATNGAVGANGRDKHRLDEIVGDPVVSQSNIAKEPSDGASAPIRTDGREVRCGPLLNYRRMDGATWHGSVLIVMRGGILEEEFVPDLTLRKLHGIDEKQISRNVNDTSGKFASSTDGTEAIGQIGEYRVAGTKLYSDSRNTFWRFDIKVEMEVAETSWQYNVPGLRFPSSKKTDKQSFFVPAVTESFRIMFHSCNGFSVGTDEDAFSGPCLWNDVIRVHEKTPFHVMIGGGDQIYNDGIRVDGPLRKWTNIGNPKKRRDFPFPESLRKECDDYYVENYVRWYSTEPFCSANGQIPQLNIWDDHDIIDGFGSYVDDFMKCDVFRGIGGTAYKYYLLFQHHLPPPISTYTTDAPQTMEVGSNGVGIDPSQTNGTYVLQNEEEEPSYIIGLKPGPYVAECSRSIYCRLGARMAFFGIDARTERTRHQVNYPETYDLIFDRLYKELSQASASPSPIQHMIVLLGIPIAYPRLTWLENIFSSPIVAPIKFLNKRFGVASGFINHFDGNVDLLDDLDDHYTARTHKRERHDLVIRLQNMAAKFSCRITILGGDVHLAAVGRFYSNPKLNIPLEADHRYMANIISSAIVNKPPPQAVANLLARRNKLHHLDVNTDETLLRFFDKDPGEAQKTAGHNKVTMPSRNWTMITENSPGNARTATSNGQALDPAPYANGSNGGNGVAGDKSASEEDGVEKRSGKSGQHPLGPGELNAGSSHRAASDQHGSAGDYSLDIAIRVEKDQHNAQGLTQSYGIWVPKLIYNPEMGEKTLKKKH